MLTIVHTISKNGHWVSLFANEDEAKKIKGRAISVFKRKEYNERKSNETYVASTEKVSGDVQESC